MKIEGECEGCGKRATVEMFPVPTNGLLDGSTRVITTAIWCRECAEENKELILSDEEVQILARNHKVELFRLRKLVN
jgi:hypothetical protein